VPPPAPGRSADDASAVVLASTSSSAQPVHKPAADSGDNVHHLDPAALSKIAEAKFAH
jgi:hypothetical protein